LALFFCYKQVLFAIKNMLLSFTSKNKKRSTFNNFPIIFKVIRKEIIYVSSFLLNTLVPVSNEVNEFWIARIQPCSGREKEIGLTEDDKRIVSRQMRS